MSKIEFKVRVTNGMIKIPEQLHNLENRIVRVVLQSEPIVEKRQTNQEIAFVDRRENSDLDALQNIKPISLDFSSLEIECFKQIHPLEYQRSLRDGK